MAIVANTFQTPSALGNREELSNVVNRITPEDTPIYSMMGKGTCTSTNPEWEIDVLADPVENKHVEGDEFSYSSVTPVTRVGNATQIFRKSFIVSKTQDKISNAGSAEQTKYQTLKKGVELRKDIELALVSNTPTVKTGTRTFGALPTWLETNTLRDPGLDANGDGDFSDAGDRATVAADGGFTGGVTTVYTAGTVRRAFTKALMDEMLEKTYAAGADVKHMVLSPYAKRKFSGFMSDASLTGQRTQIQSGQATLIGAADMYQSDFGMISVVPNRVMRGNPETASGSEETLRATQRERAANVFFIDPSMLEFKWLRPIQKVTDVAIKSDATPTVMIGEGTLCVKNEAGLGVIGDIFGTSDTK